MSASHLTVEVYGLPAPQGSKRHVGGGRMIENSPHVKTWREDVKQAALAALEESPAWDRTHTHVVMHVVFTLPRPKSHYRTGKFAHLLRDGAPRLHGTTPDLDKLLRSTCDALTTAGVYADDARVSQVFAVKAYETRASVPPGALDRPGARIVLSPGAH